jgi:hypothetical protein
MQIVTMFACGERLVCVADRRKPGGQTTGFPPEPVVLFEK